ncbi:MAG: guanylate kinase [Candidatus Marinimicrobia bacterium]|jgi:guanylate kinase|nr:guanylate kinase [Candidatus Neomarinimicrobiota bacterium]MBT3501401.1 guanylate kinase [Candidatus Neomarinimicrobiota bacterium]MBT3839460.1 guanylate kinase [Candidatus Neomarinimicrobiota bacterium]MBT3998555.1 guanylate kinase [Candidatus Neomarinimicrobiota bacterium]MBT4283027.1 guanylate kinase [Candidatus Neomarinimicrobiota bacterium]
MKNLITISAPSGSGKTTLCKELQKVMPDIEWSVSYTTREQRSIESNGEDYNFISHDEFENLIVAKELAEWENVHGYYYGTQKVILENAIKMDKIVLMELDVKGSIRIKELYPKNSFSIFIIPPSISHLRERLRKRGTDSAKRIEIRLQRFQQEMGYKEKFDHIMINDNLNMATLELIKVVNEQKEGVLNGS